MSLIVFFIVFVIKQDSRLSLGGNALLLIFDGVLCLLKQVCEWIHLFFESSSRFFWLAGLFFQSQNSRWSNLFLCHPLPVDISKERILFELIQRWPLLWVLSKNTSKEFLSFTSQIFGQLKVSFLDILIQHLNIITIVRRYAYEHFIKHYTDLVNITSLSHSLLFQHFRSQVGWRATKWLSDKILLRNFFILQLLADCVGFCQTEISKSDMPIQI